MQLVQSAKQEFENMNTSHRYSLDKSSKKFTCPECNKKRFVRFIDTTTGDYLPSQYGRCDKGDGHYFLDPRKDGYSKMIWEQERGSRSEIPNNWKPQRKKAIPQPRPEPVFFDFDTFTQTLKDYDKNTFIQNLLNTVQFPFAVEDVTKIIQLYRLGTISHGYRTGAITFPFIDIKGNVRAVQVKQFDEANHTTGTDFLHSIIEKHHTRNNIPLPEWLQSYIKEDKRISCLFGEHLLGKHPNADIYLFEAPKTAIYSTLYFGVPEQSNAICLAVYNKSSFSIDRLKVLQGRFVYVFPDLSKDGNTFKEWETKAKEYESRLPGTRFIFSDLLEQLAPERDKGEGNDLADYLIKQDWRLFRKRSIQNQVQPKIKEVAQVAQPNTNKGFRTFPDGTNLAQVAQTKIEVFKAEQIEQPQRWNNDILELEKLLCRNSTTSPTRKAEQVRHNNRLLPVP